MTDLLFTTEFTWLLFLFFQGKKEDLQTYLHLITSFGLIFFIFHSLEIRECLIVSIITKLLCTPSIKDTVASVLITIVTSILLFVFVNENYFEFKEVEIGGAELSSLTFVLLLTKYIYDKRLSSLKPVLLFGFFLYYTSYKLIFITILAVLVLEILVKIFNTSKSKKYLHTSILIISMLPIIGHIDSKPIYCLIILPLFCIGLHKRERALL